MPTVEEGQFKGMKAEVCLNPFGVYNRINISQLIEHELNFVSMHIRMKMKETENIEEKFNILSEYIKMVNKEEYESLNKFFKKLNIKHKKEFLEEVIEEGIPVNQKPFYGNTGIDELEKIYKKYPDVQEFKCKNISTPLIIAELYFIRLIYQLHMIVILYENYFNCWELL